MTLLPPRRRWAWLACLAALQAAACDEGATSAPGDPPSPTATAREAAVDATAPTDVDASDDALRAIGYVGWDEDADERLRGVTRWDPSRAAPGYQLFTDDVDRAYLVDMEGRRVHAWRLEGAENLETVELQPDGSVLAVDHVRNLALLDWDSTVLWEYRGRAVHHDATRDVDGTFLALFRSHPRDHAGRRVVFDGIVRVDARGRHLADWKSWEHRERIAAFHPPSPRDVPPRRAPRRGERHDYYHMNSLEVLPDTPLGRRDGRFASGNVLVCFRNVDLVAILDRTLTRVLWGWGPGVLELPHMPTMLPDGRILVFDNGTRRGWSRVVELDPEAERITWSYVADPPEAFYSEWRGSNQRLPNGNTLICESERGHAFEVTVSGDVVWEFWNPDLVDGKRRRIYRMSRVAPDAVAPRLGR